MLFMVIERFRDNDMVPVYRRLRDIGRTLPDLNKTFQAVKDNLQ